MPNPIRKIVVKPRTNVKHKMWVSSNLCEVKFFLTFPLSNNRQHEIAKHIQVAITVHCVFV